MHFCNLKFYVGMQKIICIIVHTMKKTGHFVNGEVIHEDGKNIEIFNPSNGEIISSINCASKNMNLILQPLSF